MLGMMLLALLAWGAVSAEELNPVIVINEVMADNDSIATYPEAEFTDWIELYNAGGTAVDLSGWCLSDNPDKPQKWHFPEGTAIAPGEYKVVLCDNTGSADASGTLRASFKIGKQDRETIILTGPDGTVHDRLTLPDMWTDISYGRDPANGQPAFFDVPTPFRMNGAGFAGYAAKPAFSIEPGLYEGPQLVKIRAAEGTQVYFTTDGSEPTQASTQYTSGSLQVNATAVIRVKAFGSGTVRPSETLTGTFFIDAPNNLPIVSVTVDPKDLFDPERGMLTVGTGVHKEAGKLPFKNTVYRKVKDSGIKYGSYVEMYDDAGNRIVSQGAEVSLNGDYSLDMPQKSFKFRAKSRYGKTTFKAKLFPDRDYTEYEGFVLRNSGNDSMWTRLQDGFQSRLMDYCGSTVAHQAWKPYAVYLNGMYWGHMNLRERVDRFMVAQFEGLSLEEADQVDLLQGNGIVKYGSNAEYKAMIKKIKAGKPAKKKEDLQYILDNVDVDNYFEFMAFEMFFGNSDIGNIRFYRLKTPGSKWKWLINDLDYGLYDSGFNSPKSYTKKTGMGQMNIDNTIFLKLLSVPEYKDRFLTIYGRIFQQLTTERMLAILDELVETIRPEMSLHWARWGAENDKYVISEVPTTADGAYKYWEKRVARLQNVCKKRPHRLWEFTKKAFSLSNKEMIKYFGEQPEMPADAI